MPTWPRMIPTCNKWSVTCYILHVCPVVIGGALGGCVLQKVKEQSKKIKSEKKIKVCVCVCVCVCATALCPYMVIEDSCHIWSLKEVAIYGH